MLIKVIYIIIFFIADLVIWLLMNKPTLFSRKVQYLLAVVFALFILLHTGIVQSLFLLPWKDFFNLIVITCAPVLLFAWYTGLLARHKSRGESETALSSSMLTAAKILFSYLINVAALVLQVMMLMGYYQGRL